MQSHNSVFNELPKVVVALATVIGGLEIMFQLATAGLLGGQGGVGWRQAALLDFGIQNQIVDWMLVNGSYPPEHLLRFLTYPLIHFGLLDAAFAVVFILAMGKVVGEVFSPIAFLALFWLCSIIGALAYTLPMDPPYVLAGAFPGAYGLIGAFTFLLWVDLGRYGANQYRAFSFIAILMAVKLLFGLLGGSFAGVVPDLAGFVAGFGLSFLLAPGGWARVLDKLRQR